MCFQVPRLAWYVVMVCRIWLDVGGEVDSKRIVKRYFFWLERRVEGDG